MPLGKKTATRTRKVLFDVKGESVIRASVPEENQFLTIAAALPILPGTPVPPKLSNRSYNSLSSTGIQSEIERAETRTCDVVTLQWTGETKTIVASRTPAEQEKTPDRICLDRRGLTTFPNVIGEPKLRLMSLQHNLLTKIETFNISHLTKLVFLDLYDNQIEKVCDLSLLENLRVLLIGKNRIKKIQGLKQLLKLEILDLHGNQIPHISGLEDLSSLKVLNLAGNSIKTIGYHDFQGLTSLKELNLRRNKLRKLLGFGETPHLQKLYLNNNDIRKIEDMGSLAKALQIKEIALDGNPVTLNADYIPFLVSYLPNLQILSTMQISEQIRRTAMAWRFSKEQSNSAFLDLSTQVSANVRREEVISNAKINWELLRFKSKASVDNSNKMANNINALRIQSSSKFNAVNTKSLDKTKPKSFGSLTSINENVEARKIHIKKRSCSSDNLLKLKDTSKLYSWEPCPLEFKLPPILDSIVDSFKNNKLEDTLLKENENKKKVLYDNTSDSELDSSESHESLKSGLRCHLLAPNNSGLPVDSKSTAYKSLMVSNSATSATTADLCSENNKKPGYDETVPAASQRHIKFNTIMSENKILNNKCLEDIQVFYDQDERDDYQSKSTLNTSGYCSSVSKASSLDSCKSLNSSPPPIPKTVVRKSYDCEQDKGRIKSAQVRKIIYYKSNRAATARARFRALAPSSPPPQPLAPKEREQGGDYLIEIVGRCLNIYGQGSLRFIDKTWDVSKAQDVNIVKFNYVQFNDVAKVLNKLKNRFPHVEHFVFKETNISLLGQLNALAEVQGLTSIQIDAGNPIASKDWKMYAIFRLAHWGLTAIDGKEITTKEIEFANEEYAGLIDIVTCSLPDSLLQPLLQRLRLEKVQRQSEERITAKQFLFNCDVALRSVVAKEALQWRKGSVTQDDLIWRHKGKVHFLNLIIFTINAIQKLQVLEKQWPYVLYEIIYNTLSDFSEMDVYMKRCSETLESNK